MDWLAAYEADTPDRPWQLGEQATLTVILRDLDNDSRSHAFIAVEPAPPGDEQREIILRAMAGRFPDARWKTTTRRSRSRASSADGTCTS